MNKNYLTNLGIAARGEDSNTKSPHLSPREQDVLALLACGLQNKEIAKVLTISPNTVAGYVKDIYQKLGIHNRCAATFIAIELGLVKSQDVGIKYQHKSA